MTNARVVMVYRLVGIGLLGVVHASVGYAHGISEESRETMSDGGVLDYVWLGAEHMVTGFDHLLFLVGVVFFLTGFKDVVRFITAFTIGHCITLLGATLAGVTANAYLIDAVIALSVIYKGFENLDGFKRYLNMSAPNLLGMVFGFGLIHGFGLSTRLQELPLPDEGLIPRILAFNVGVELGQVLALTLMLGGLAAWRSSATFTRFSTASNLVLVAAGAGLFVMQINGFVSADTHHDDHHGTEASGQEEHGHQHGMATTAHDHGEHGHDHGTANHGHDHTTSHTHDREQQTDEDGDHRHKSHHRHGHGTTNHGQGATSAHDHEPPSHTHGSGHGHDHGENGKNSKSHGHTHGSQPHSHDKKTPHDHAH